MFRAKTFPGENGHKYCRKNQNIPIYKIKNATHPNPEKISIWANTVPKLHLTLNKKKYSAIFHIKIQVKHSVKKKCIFYEIFMTRTWWQYLFLWLYRFNGTIDVFFGKKSKCLLEETAINVIILVYKRNFFLVKNKTLWLVFFKTVT